VKGWRTTWQVVGDALQLGASIVFAILIGAAFGFWLDSKLNSFPWFSIVFFLLGVAAAGRNVWLAVRRELRRDLEYNRDDEKDKESNQETEGNSGKE
jgi:F0F1-type ATP synthase assembly protein I